MMGFVILNAFSTSILSTTIKTSNTVIDSLEDLILRNDLIPLIHLSELHISRIQVQIDFTFIFNFKILFLIKVL